MSFNLSGRSHRVIDFMIVEQQARAGIVIGLLTAQDLDSRRPDRPPHTVGPAPSVEKRGRFRRNKGSGNQQGRRTPTRGGDPKPHIWKAPHKASTHGDGVS
jgi:hypothetical protein